MLATQGFLGEGLVRVKDSGTVGRTIWECDFWSFSINCENKLLVPTILKLVEIVVMDLGIVDNKRAFWHFEPPQTEQVVDGAFPFYATCWKDFASILHKETKWVSFF